MSKSYFKSTHFIALIEHKMFFYIYAHNGYTMVCSPKQGNDPEALVDGLISQSRGRTWGLNSHPLKNHKNIGFLSNTGPDLLNPKPVFNVCGLLLVKWCFDTSLINKKKKKKVKKTQKRC